MTIKILLKSLGKSSKNLKKRLFRWLKKPVDEKIFSLTNRFNKAMDLVSERAKGLDFQGNIPNEELITEYSTSLPHASAYMGCSSVQLISLIKKAKKNGIQFENLIDIGSGKGKICFYSAKKFSFKKIIGIEFSHPLVDIAKANFQKLKYDNVEFLCMDALDYHLPKAANLVLMFNPFDSVIMGKFITNNIEHFKEYGSMIIYINDLYRDTLSGLGFKIIFRNSTTKDSLFEHVN